MQPSTRLAGPAWLVPFLLATACGGTAAADPNQREIPWSYGPTTGAATAEHVQATGTKGGKAITRGWQLRLRGKHLEVKPYEPSAAHPLFGKVVMNIGLFDKAEKQIGSLRSAPITEKTTTFGFDLEDDIASRLQDVVIWFRQP